MTAQDSQYGPQPLPASRRLAAAWLGLGVCALGVAGIFAILLVLARAPGTSALFPTQDFFRTALVVHVDQSVLIWFLAFAGMLWSLHARPGVMPMRWLSLALAAGGAALLAASPFLGAGDPSLNNYVPVLRHPVFHAALLLFGIGIVLQVLSYGLRHHPARLWPDPLHIGIYTAGLATLASVGSLIWSGLSLADLPGRGQSEAYFELLFWGGGHILQFAYTQVMLVAWIWTARQAGIRIPLADRWLSLVLVLGVLPLLAAPLIHLAYPIASAEFRNGFTALMQYGNSLAAVPIGLLILFGLSTGRAFRDPAMTAPYRALLASLLLFAVGGLLGVMIGDVNTVITAHYHGSIVGVTLALMGLSYLLLPRLGWAPATGRMARIQPVIYATGQLLHIGGLAVSGMMGIERKTAGSEQGLDGLTHFFMGIMGLGGLLAVIGGILFVLVIARSFLGRERP
ncbi:conserved hypothetical protein [Thioalkalivibrio sulfidiphilus HL-EbGr7]|uniref:Cytochrome C oxidase subunit I n=1 Tax=Thioalkalivibrio sulfidiphilus (strain HL-EbGR7) TaxID=396588 RepID=B8GPF2_THISH|nr:cbb3-type cytochrome c oxidase subunit I [Thioalkalivibrio sulfidiphilus]ACL74072.1 conserved hypothetical protein [Thioalkalivibrio sulfidiphilus HL-EbGr7]